MKFTCRLRRGALVFRYRSSHYPMLLLARQGWFVDPECVAGAAIA
ncbi:hypothetical protein ACFXG4_34885 [Nocardia sp. NPDC059246]